MSPSSRQVAVGLVLAVFLGPMVGFEQGVAEAAAKKKKTSKPKPDAKPEEKKAEEAPLPIGGLDLGGEAAAPQPAKESAAKEAAPARPAATPSSSARPADKPAEKPVAAEKNVGPAKPMTFEGLDVSGKSSERQKLEVALGQFKAEQYEAAALTARDLMDNPALAAIHLEAQYLLAKSLYRMGLYHSSLGEFSKILQKGPQTKYFKTSLEWLFFISHKTTNEGVILDEIARYSNYEFPEKFRTEFRYLLARYNAARGRALDEAGQKAEANKSFDEVVKLARQIPKGDPFYPRAKYLEGLAYFRQDRYEDSLEAMKEVVRATRAASGKTQVQQKIDQEIRELAFMQLARTHYGHRQNRKALYYYGKVERGGSQWLEALFESGWANYRVGQYEQALGNFITLSSPFFQDEYFPEALIIKAVIYFENCRYREAMIILKEFWRIYLPVHDQLELLLKKDMMATEYYNILSEVQKKNREAVEKSGTDQILERILRLALTDKDLKATNDSVLELEGEMDAIGAKTDAFKYSNLAKSLLEGLKAAREGLAKKAGIMAKGKLEFGLEELKMLLANAERIKFEIIDAEKNFLEEQIAAGGKASIVKKYKYSVAVADDQLYWPYVGEYWRDELGTYTYTLTKGCIERKGAR